jgi:hypothetical protein
MGISEDHSLPCFLSGKLFRIQIYIRLSLVPSFDRLAMETTLEYTTTRNKQAS